MEMDFAMSDFRLEPFRPPFRRAAAMGADCLDLMNMPLTSLLYYVLVTSFEYKPKPRD